MVWLWLLVGFVVGAAVIWFVVKRRVDDHTASIETSYEGRLKHLQEEVGRADAAHDETKAKILGLLEERNAAEERAGKAGERAAALERELAAARDEIARLQSLPRSAPVPAVAAPAPVPATVDPALQRIRAIDAKLKMLPAGSSARNALLAERAGLLDGGTAAALPAAPPGAAPDDLEIIKGIGPKINDELKAMGIVTFAQLAALSPAQVTTLEERIGFPGRVAREQWIEQARQRLG